jgi:hypothetical protein
VLHNYNCNTSAAHGDKPVTKNEDMAKEPVNIMLFFVTVTSLRISHLQNNQS